VDYVNDPYVIGQHDNMISVNSALQADLMGQVNAEMIGAMQFSGIGGQVDFVRGASRSRGGKSIIAMPSTAAGGKTSRICRELDKGAAVTTSRSDVHYVVTEYGVADLRGKTLRQRAEALIAIAHPDFRGLLRGGAQSEAKELAFA
jgi:4-hydroxybutyrate CoA-transferase